MKRLIVNADDFGLTEKVNQAIIEGHLKGIITSTSLLANGVAFESAVRLAQLHPKLGVGVHLNLTDGSPVSAPARIPSLVTDKGVFSLALSRWPEKSQPDESTWLTLKESFVHRS